MFNILEFIHRFLLAWTDMLSCLLIETASIWITRPISSLEKVTVFDWQIIVIHLKGTTFLYTNCAMLLGD